MIQQPDSTHHSAVATSAPEAEAVTARHIMEAAEREDSAARDVYATTRSHWPVKVDSLLRPEMSHEPQVRVGPLPKYYKETFFAKDSLLHSELHAGRYGIAGDPVPYSVRGDNVLTPLLIASVLLLMYSVSRAARFYSFQARNFFRQVRLGSAMERESSAETRYLIFGEAHTSIILALVAYAYTKAFIAETYVTYSEYTLMAIDLGVVLSLLSFEHLMERLVGHVFFTPAESAAWMQTKRTVTAAAGMALTPMLLLWAYFGLSIGHTLGYTLCVAVVAKTLLFFKCFQIFFSKKNAYVQNILYFCTLEVIPPLLAWGVICLIANLLKVNYQ